MMKSNTAIAVLVTAAIFAAIVVGLMASGSPQHNRDVRFDRHRTADLNRLAQQIAYHARRSGALPVTMEDLPLSSQGSNDRNDPRTNEPYEYETGPDLNFALCAVFETEGPHVYQSIQHIRNYEPDVLAAASDEPVTGSGRQCFEYVYLPSTD